MDVCIGHGGILELSVHEHSVLHLVTLDVYITSQFAHLIIPQTVGYKNEGGWERKDLIEGD